MLHLLAQALGEHGIGRVEPGRGLKQDGRGAGDDGENVVGGLEGCGNARITQLGKLGGEGVIDGAVTIIDDQHLLQRTHDCQG